MIDPDRINAIIVDSLYRDDELSSDALIGEGVVQTFGFQPERLRSHEAEVKAMLMQLGDDFMKSKGGGTSFLSMPFDKEGNQWGEQPNAGQLLALGTALGLVKLAFPRDMWPSLPGGVPYVTVVDR